MKTKTKCTAILIATAIIMTATPAYAELRDKSIRECVTDTITDLRNNTWWVEDYHLGSWDCSTQSATLWYALADKGIIARIVAAIYCEGNMPKNHIYLTVEMEGRPVMVDATSLEIRGLPPDAYGYLPIQTYNNPIEANRAWPGEYIRMGVREKGGEIN